jgi:hypothetical protein
MPGSKLISRDASMQLEASRSTVPNRLRAEPPTALVATALSPGAGTSSAECRQPASPPSADRLLVDTGSGSPSAMRMELMNLEEQVSELRVKLSLANAAVEWGGASPAARAIWRWRRRNDLRRAHAAAHARLLTWEAELREEAATLSAAAATVSRELSALKQESALMLSVRLLEHFSTCARMADRSVPLR